MNDQRNIMMLACAIGALSVILGAFGAHALKARIDEYGLSVFEVGVRYQFYHALALGMLALSGRLFSHSIALPSVLFLLGIVFFSFSLYALSLTGIRALGAITPLGGLLFIAGWVSWIWALRKG